MLRDTFGQQFGHHALIVRAIRTIALRLAAERMLRMQIGVVVDLHERFQRDAQHAAVVQQILVMMRNPPRARIDVQALVEFAMLGGSAEFGKRVATTQ